VSKHTHLLLPVRVLACAIDPGQVVNARRLDALSKWSWSQPDYAGLTAGATRRLSSVWPSLFNKPKPGQVEAPDQVGLPPPLRGDVPRRGVCVSWSVPPGWSRLPTRDADADSLPRLPDRWLVVRFARRTHAPGDARNVTWAPPAEPPVRLWIVDAGARSTGAASAAVLAAGAGGTELRHVGAARDAKDAPAASAEDPVPLHIQGSERSPDLTFGAFAPANLDNLSFIDPLDDPGLDVAHAALSYVVLGWYRRPGEHDPLARLPADPAARAAAVRALGLDPLADLVEGGLTEAEARERLGLGVGEALPLGDRCVFHGVVSYVDYFNESSYRGASSGVPLASDTATLPAVGFGLTAEQALARVCAGVSKDAKQSAAELHAEFLEQLLTDQLWALDEVGSAELQRRAATASRFRPVPGGTEWTVAPEAAPEPPGEKRSPAFVSLTPALRRGLHDLDEAQRRLDEGAVRLAWSAEIFHTCWWLLQSEPGPARTVKGLADFLDAHGESLVAQLVALREEQGQFARQREALERLLAAVPDRKLVLTAREPAPFHLPKEPAVALRDLGPRVPQRVLPPLGRLLDRVAARRGAEAPPPREAWLGRLPAALAGKDEEEDRELRDVLAALLVEGQLAEAWVADAVRHHSDAATPADDAAWQARVAKLRELLGESGPRVSSTRLNFTAALLPAQGPGAVDVGAVCSVWSQQPWVPLFLDWEARWFQKASGKGVPFEGRTLLTHRPQSVIGPRVAALQQAAAADGDRRARLLASLQENGTVLRDAARSDVVAQTLGGLDQQLLGRDDALPRIAPSAADPTVARLRDVVQQQLAPRRAAAAEVDTVFAQLLDLVGQTSMGPLRKKPSPPEAWTSWSSLFSTDFSLVRQGSLSIERLWVVDRFGQALALGYPHDQRPMRPPLALPRKAWTSDADGERGALLERRLLEPTRVALRFEMPAGSSSRVRGWILPNLLDKSVVVYCERGRALGVILAAGDATRWYPVEAPAGEPVTRAVEDEALRRFVTRLVAVEGDDEAAQKQKRARFKALLQQIDAALPRTQPGGAPDGNSPAALLGRPLALVRVGLSVERRGGPTFNPGWLSSSILANLKANFDAVLCKYRPHDKKEVVSVAIGSRYLPDDGVIGYYLDGQDDLRKTRKLDPAAPPVALQVPGHVPADLQRVPGYKPLSPQGVDLLLDPRGKIHLEPDLLPAAVAGLAPEWYADDLRGLRAVVRVTSVLVGGPADLLPGPAGARRRVDLPLPAGSGKRAVELSPTSAPAGKEAVAPPPPEVLLRIRGADIDVAPAPPLSAVPGGEVAAADGFLIV
jgi:hypothetical protein